MYICPIPHVPLPQPRWKGIWRLFTLVWKFLCIFEMFPMASFLIKHIKHEFSRPGGMMVAGLVESVCMWHTDHRLSCICSHSSCQKMTGEKQSVRNTASKVIPGRVPDPSTLPYFYFFFSYSELTNVSTHELFFLLVPFFGSRLLWPLKVTLDTALVTAV